MPKTMAAGLIAGERFLGVYNFTPGQSVSVVDLSRREFIAEVPTPGCGFLLANGKLSFTSICANGSMLTTHLDDNGKQTGSSKTEVLFDAENDPVFEGAAIVDGIAYFPTFKGQVLPIDVRDETVTAQATWSLTADDEKNWRPGGIRPVLDLHLDQGPDAVRVMAGPRQPHLHRLDRMIAAVGLQPYTPHPFSLFFQ